MAAGTEQSFKRVLLRRDVLALAVGAMVGFSWSIYAANWTVTGGTLGAVLAFAAVGVLCTFVGLAYGELTSMFPRTAGEVVFVYRSLGENLAWFVGWFLISAYAMVAFFEAVFFPFLLAQIGLPVPQVGALWTIGGVTVYASWVAVSVVGVLFFAGLNYLGVRFSGSAQTIGVFVLLVVGLAVGLAGLGLGSASNAAPMLEGYGGISAVMFLAPAFLLGFGTIPQVAEEMNISTSTSGKLVPAAIWLAVAFYSIVILGIGFGASLDARSGGLGVQDAVAAMAGSDLAAQVVMAGALAGMLTSWNAFFLASSRVFYGLGRARMLPEWFAKLDPERGTPTNAIHAMVVISIAWSLVGIGIIEILLNVVSFFIVLAWGLVFAAFIVLRRDAPELERPFRVPQFTAVAVLGVVAIAFFLLNYTPLNPSGGLPADQWAVIAGYLVVGAIVFAGWFRRSGDLPDSERYDRLVGTE